MRRLYLAPLLLVGLAVGACTPVKGARPVCRVPTPQEMVAEVNADRATHGLDPVVLDPTLTDLAHGWASHMANVGVLYHSSDEYRHGQVWENISGPAYSCPDAALIELDFMVSPAHASNILEPNHNRFGGAVVADADGRLWAVQHFLYRTAGHPTF